MILHEYSLNYNIYISLGLCILTSFVLAVVILGASYGIAIQTPDVEKTSSYECGFEPFEDSRNRYDFRFSIIAILFLIFDIEIIFLFPWAISLNITGMEGYFTGTFFLLVLTLGFIYEIAKGALNFT
jgi:NADH-quinone oxidoreductase subunit A